MNQVYSLMKKHKVFSTIRQQPFTIIQTLFNYLKQCFQKVPLNTKQKEKYINAIIILTVQQIEKEKFTKTQQQWLRLIFIELFANLSDKSILTEQIIDLLSSLCIRKPLQLKKENENQLSQSFFSFKQLFQPKNPNNDDQRSCIKTIKIIEGIQLIVRKKLSNHEFFASFSQQQNQQNQLNHQNYKDLKSSQEKVWKIINHFKSYDGILKNYKSLEEYNFKIKPYMLATFVLIGLDIIKMYPYIVKLIQLGVSLIEDKYQNIQKDYKQKQKRRRILSEIYKSSLFIEMKNLIKQLQSINWTIMYVFYGIHHATEMQLRLPKEFMLNTGHVKLDVVYKIEMEVEMIKNKRQREKQNIRRLSFELSKFNNTYTNKTIQQKHQPFVILTPNKLTTKKTNQNNALQSNQNIKRTYFQQKQSQKLTSNFSINDTGQSESYFGHRLSYQTTNNV